MDTAKFIRKKSVLAAWLAVPLLLALIAEVGSAAFREHQQITCQRDEMLEQLIPRMLAEKKFFDAFIADYELKTAGGVSAEDLHITLCSEAAQKAGFTITSMSVTQEPVNTEMGVWRIRMNVEGEGLGREVANFFKELKNRDKLIYEENVRLTRAANSAERLDAEVSLCKVYTRRNGGGRP